MIIRNLISFVLMLFICINCSYAQSLEDVSRTLKEMNTDLGLEESDLKDLIISAQHTSKQSGITHIYLRQRYKGIEIYNADLSLHLKNNEEIIKVNNNFIASLANKIRPHKSMLSSKVAVQTAARKLGYDTKGELIIIEAESGINRKQSLQNPRISKDPIPVRLMYYATRDGAIRLTWEMSILELKEEHWWQLRVDVETGEILSQEDLIIHCMERHDHAVNKVCNGHHDSGLNIPDFTTEENLNTMLVGGYRVLALPFSDPIDGARSLINDPDDPVASPFGWHDTDGMDGSESTETTGNNVDAFDSGDNNGFRPDGGVNLVFDFPLDITGDPDDFEEAAITNIFYLCNVTHDIFYRYGFDEASGNFQENNYGNGGLGGDRIDAHVQNNENCGNAGSFFRDVDGNDVRIEINTCGSRDGSFNNTTIVHEVTHGLSLRLVGGAGNVECLGNGEHMGEGWSDYFALLTTIEATDTRTTSRFYGSWYYNDADGIRPFPYNTDMTVNPQTYNDIISTGVHATGSVWCTMLWDMTWDLIDLEGFDTDLHTGTGGNNIAMQLVIEAMKLTPCSPGFVDARDAILDADEVLYDGTYRCLIWEAFARRGLGIDADQGSNNSDADGTESFDTPDNCECQENLTLDGTIASTIYQVSNNITATGTIVPGSEVVMDAGNQILLQSNFVSAHNFYAFIDGCMPMFQGEDQETQYRIRQQSDVDISNTLNPTQQTRIRNYPNPFSESTTFEIQLKERTSVRLELFDISGRLVKTLINNELMDSGTHQVELNAKQLQSGIYIYKFSTEQETKTDKVILEK